MCGSQHLGKVSSYLPSASQILCVCGFLLYLSDDPTLPPLFLCVSLRVLLREDVCESLLAVLSQCIEMQAAHIWTGFLKHSACVSSENGPSLRHPFQHRGNRAYHTLQMTVTSFLGKTEPPVQAIFSTFRLLRECTINWPERTNNSTMQRDGLLLVCCNRLWYRI